MMIHTAVNCKVQGSQITTDGSGSGAQASIYTHIYIYRYGIYIYYRERERGFEDSLFADPGELRMQPRALSKESLPSPWHPHAIRWPSYGAVSVAVAMVVLTKILNILHT